MAEALSDLSAWFEEFWGEKLPTSANEDLFSRFGIEGDDASDFVDSFLTRFEVDPGDYRWYFHHGEEGWNVGALFFAPPYRRVKSIPITTETLLEAIRTRRWPLEYPDHTLPKVRWDIWINLLLILLPLALTALAVGWRLLG